MTITLPITNFLSGGLITNDKTNVNDAWAQNNYFEFKPSGTGFDPIIGGRFYMLESYVPTKGKIFGYEYRTDGNNVYYSFSW
jgi:hypothetical protein